MLAHQQCVVKVVGVHHDAVDTRHVEGLGIEAGGVLLRETSSVVVVHLVVHVVTGSDAARQVTCC